MATDQNSNDPLHGITLKTILSELVGRYGWEEMAQTINIRCFTHDPSITSSLKFLRRTPWARDKVEEMYLRWKLESGEAVKLRNPSVPE
ncbi:MAG: VF530 family protein [Desulfuromonadaceae bacterium]|nr:VF530 family protein [Desulfuromonadaceae bacterium]